MVSNARLDLPEPDSPVITTTLSRGISTEMFLRLWTRAPWTAIVVRTGSFRAPRAGAGLERIRRLRHHHERELLHVGVAPPGEAGGHRHLADQPLIRQVFACHDHAGGAVVLREVVLDLPAGTGLAS